MRLDQFLLNKGYARSRTQASDLIKAGKVKIFLKEQWQTVFKTSHQCDENVRVEVEAEGEFSWVSRSGEKLHLALKRLDLNLKNLDVFDVGQSTGGFSECALLSGARSVVGVDVGKGQLSDKLKKDARLSFYEGLDARYLKEEKVFHHSAFDFLVMDVSFISAMKVLKPVLEFLKKGSRGLILIKPQFEVGPSNIKKGGLVDSSTALLDCQRGVFSSINSINELTVMDYFPSDLRGKDGNQEFFLFIKIS